jgi:hypothetical protein
MQKLFVSLLLITVACGPSSRSTPGGDDDNNNGGGGDGGGGGSSTADCATNCNNPACSGIDGCPVCGMVDQPEGSGIELPDTNAGNMNPSCTTSANCTSMFPNCIQSELGGYCAQSYDDTLDFIGFGSGQTLTDTTKLLSVCATMEHSYYADLQIELVSPDGKIAHLRKFAGRDIGEFFLGHANDCDENAPTPGVGYKYCWTVAASTTMLNSSNTDCAAATGCENWNGQPMNTCEPGESHSVIPAGNYLPDDGTFSALQGAQLNGNWTFRITDLWAQDNGFIFDWTIQFDPSLVSDCSNPIIQ